MMSGTGVSVEDTLEVVASMLLQTSGLMPVSETAEPAQNCIYESIKRSQLLLFWSIIGYLA